MAPLKVVICGGGFSATEALLRLHRLAGKSVEVTLIAPNRYLKYRPLTVFTPFGEDSVPRYPLRDLLARTGAAWLHDRVTAIDHRERTVYTADSGPVHYDALLLALGAKERKRHPHVTLFTDRTGGQTYRTIVAGIDSGAITRLALIEPSGPSWPLPLYELALFTAKHARDRGLRLQIALIVPHPHPLYPFGTGAGGVVEQLLRDAGVTPYLGRTADIAGTQSLRLHPGGDELDPQQIVTLPTITGPSLPGVPGDARDRFIPVDDRCRVRGTDGRVFAAGDATDLPVKHGSLAAEQADVAAAGIAHLAGAKPAQPFRPVLRGTLLTGGTPLYLEAHLVAGTSWESRILTEPTWPAGQLVVAEELAAYLADHAPERGTG